MNGHGEFRTVKLSDIASRLNISVVTVSNALNGKKGVSDELRRHIVNTADEMGYKKRLRSDENIGTLQLSIGVVTAARYVMAEMKPYFMRLYQEIAFAAAKKDCIISLEILSDENEEQAIMPDVFVNNSIDAVIIFGELNEKYIRVLSSNTSVPIVYVDYYRDAPGNDVIVNDYFYGTCSMTRLLIECGYEKIGFLKNKKEHPEVADCYFGYCKAMIEHGLEVCSRWTASVRVSDHGDWTVNLPEELPEAYVCACDAAAGALIKELKRQGYSVPEDIAVVGFGNIGDTEPEDIMLTTYALNLQEMARVIIDTAIKKLNDKKHIPARRIIKGSRLLGKSHKDRLRSRADE